jgi:RNA-directed DNA polymerase
MVKAALEPEWEARFEANSYGFRPGRCTMDAIEALHTTMSRKGASQWVLDADISGCFDTIAHDVLLAKIPVFTTTIRRWLKAGVVELGHYTATDTGTPQGGVASPLLANIALDGMERLFGSETAEGKPVLPSRRKGLNRGVSLIRYADDFVVVAPSREVLETYVLSTLTAFLAERGLRLSEAKTRIVHVTAGFNFLGFQIRRYNNKLLTKPQKEKVLQHLHSTKAYLRANQQAPAGRIIRDLNPKIRGWCNYYRHCAAKQTFGYVQHRTWQMLWRWAKRRHPNKPSKWVHKRYFKDDGWWTFHAKNAELAKYPATPVTRYVKVSGRSSPFDPTLRAYWKTRTKRLVGWQIVSKRLLALLRRQDYRCAKCGMALEPDDLDGSLHMHHKVQRDVGGADDLDNLEVVHSWCHHQHHQRCGYRSRCAKAQAV